MIRVAVVGGGVIGLAVAEELARRGARVELFERAGEVGRESSSSAAGILAPQGEVKGPGPWLELLLAGYQMIPEMVARLESATGLELRYRASGMLSAALTDEDEQELERQFRWQSEQGLRVERVSASQIRSLEPAVDGPVRWGLWWPQCSQLDNTRLVEAYRLALQRQGGLIRTATPVLRFLLEQDQVIGVETPAGPVRADWVVNCAGSWAGFDAAFPLPIPTFPVRGQMLRFRTRSPLIQRIVRSSSFYLVQRSEEQLVAGTTVERAGYDKSVTEEGLRSIRAGVGRIASRLNGWEPEVSWAGLRPGTPDGMPILGPSPFRRLLLAVGHYRNGILLAPFTGRLIADRITQERCAFDWSPFGVDRFLAKAVLTAH